jgi:macrolide transport system ATP-binding/permease protein
MGARAMAVKREQRRAVTFSPARGISNMHLAAFWEQLVQDLRYAFRTMAAQPLFTAMAALSLALGIGANTAIFSFMDAILLRALPVPHPESLVVLNWRARDSPPLVHSINGAFFRDPKIGFTSGNFPYAAYEQLRTHTQVFASLFASYPTGPLNLLAGNQAELASGQYVSGNYFGGLDIAPAAGRWIDPSDDRPGSPLVAVLSFPYAQRRFGEPGSALRQSVLVNNQLFTVAGVAAPGFLGVDPAGAPDLYLPLHSNLVVQPLPPSDNPNRLYVDNTFYWVRMMGRLRPGITCDQAQAELAPAFHNFVDSTATNSRERADLPALYLQEGAAGLDFLRRQYSRPLYVLMTMVALILAIACANIANLLLARASSRRREMALRLSLGAGRFRVVRQLLTESVSLAALGGLLGIAFAAWGIRALTLLIGNGRPNFTLYAALNWHVLALAIALSLATGILFGLAPALQSMCVDLHHALRQTRAGDQRLRFASWCRIAPSHLLVVSQIAISLLLLISAGLFVRTLTNLNVIALGFNAERLMLFTVNAHQAGYKDDALVRFYEDLRTRLAAIPGVRGVTASDRPLVSGGTNSTRVRLPGFTGTNPLTSFLNVAPGFFTTMQIPILIGREIDERDVRQGAPVAVVNEAFVQKFCDGHNPIGLRFGWAVRGAPPQIEIVGVSRNARYASLKQDFPPVAYLPYSQTLIGLHQMTFELRAAGNPLALAQSARQAVRDADPRIPAYNIETQTGQIDQTISQERTFATLCTCFALLAVLIAGVGLYGTMAYSVARRTGEIGLRMALGAQRGSVVWMVLREVLAMSAAGLAIGFAAAAATSHLLEGFLFQMKPNDPLALALAGVILCAAGLLAGYGPARRASQIDPWTALRDE